MTAIRVAFAALLASALLAACGGDTELRAPASGGEIGDYAEGMESHAGFLPFYLDRGKGRVYLARGETKRARAHLQRAAVLGAGGPEGAEARRLLETLRP